MEHFWACFEGIYIIIDNKDKLLIIFQQVDVYLSDELKSKLIKNQDYPVNQFKGALVIETTKITRILLSESKRWIGHSKHRNKKKNWKIFCFDFLKKHIREKNGVAPMDFQEYYRKSGVTENSNIYWNERYCYVSKSRWSVQYLENSASH